MVCLLELTNSVSTLNQASEEATVTVKVALRLEGLDLRHLEAYERIPEDLAELSFQSHGGVSLAVVYTDEPSPAHEAAEWARRIFKLIPGVYVAETFDELVSTADIAARCEVAPEAVRLWAAGKRRSSVRAFPAPRQVVGSGSGGKTMSLYAWREVLSWVRDVISIDPDEGITYLDSAQFADLNAELAGLAEPAAAPELPWRPMQVQTPHVTTATGQAIVLGSGAVGGRYTRFHDVLEDVCGPAADSSQRLATR